MQRVSSDSHVAHASFSPIKAQSQVKADAVRSNEPVSPKESKHFREFAQSATIYDHLSGDLYFDVSNVPSKILADVCRREPIDAMHAIAAMLAVAEPYRNCGKTLYAQVCNHRDRPWTHAWLEGCAELGEPSALEKSQARAVLAKHLGGAVDAAVELLFQNVNTAQDAIWVDFQSFNQGLKAMSLADPQLRDVVAALTPCLKSFVNRHAADAWDRTYILYPVDAGLRLSA